MIPVGGGFPMFKDDNVSSIPSTKVEKTDNLKAYKSGNMLVLEVSQPIYDISGLVERMDIEGESSQRDYIVKSVYDGNVEVRKVNNM